MVPHDRGIKHGFPFINISKVRREVLKIEGPCDLMNDKIMFDRYYCINSAKKCKNKENIGALYFITSSHFPTLVCFKKMCMVRAEVKYSKYSMCFV